jgi:hypothetical protein
MHVSRKESCRFIQAAGALKGFCRPDLVRDYLQVPIVPVNTFIILSVQIHIHGNT